MGCLASNLNSKTPASFAKLSISANTSKTVTIENNSRVIAFAITNTGNGTAMGVFGISTTSTGGIYKTKFAGGQEIDITAAATNSVTFTHSGPSGGGIIAFMCFDGSVTV